MRTVLLNLNEELTVSPIWSTSDNFWRNLNLREITELSIF